MLRKIVCTNEIGRTLTEEKTHIIQTHRQSSKQRRIQFFALNRK